MPNVHELNDRIIRRAKVADQIAKPSDQSVVMQSEEAVSDLFLEECGRHIHSIVKVEGCKMSLLMGLSAVGAAIRRGNKLLRLQVLLRWVHRQRLGHVNAAPQHYTPAQSTAWVAGWDAAMARVLELEQDYDLLKEKVPSEDIRLDA